MPSHNPIKEKSFKFAVQIVLFCRALMKKDNEYVLSKQLLRSGTSVGANVEEAQRAQSKKDFIAKMTISHKEASETHYWLRLLRETNIGDLKQIDVFLHDIHEILSLLTAIIKTSKDNNQ